MHRVICSGPPKKLTLSFFSGKSDIVSFFWEKLTTSTFWSNVGFFLRHWPLQEGNVFGFQHGATARVPSNECHRALSRHRDPAPVSQRPGTARPETRLSRYSTQAFSGDGVRLLVRRTQIAALHLASHDPFTVRIGKKAGNVTATQFPRRLLRVRSM